MSACTFNVAKVQEMRTGGDKLNTITEKLNMPDSQVWTPSRPAMLLPYANLPSSNWPDMSADSHEYDTLHSRITKIPWNSLLLAMYFSDGSLAKCL